MGTKLYVGNLPFNTTENELQEIFAQAGAVQEVTLMQDRFTGKSRGFAFVTMSSDEEAQNAISKFNGHTMDGRPMTVNEARPREQRPPGGGGGGGGRYGGGGYGGGGGVTVVVASEEAAATSQPALPADRCCRIRCLSGLRLRRFSALKTAHTTAPLGKCGQGWIRTSEGVKPADLQSAPFGRFGTYPLARGISYILAPHSLQLPLVFAAVDSTNVTVKF